jgi:copper homeostasis protein CutC
MQPLIRPKESSIYTTQEIRVSEDNLYRLQHELVQSLVHNNDNLCELWHNRMELLHHKALPIMREIVTSLAEFNIAQHGVCRVCTLGKHAKAAFRSNEHRSKEILDQLHLDVYGLMSIV